MSKKAKPSGGGLRDHLPGTPRREEFFRWRGNEVSRVEGFTDAVFAFAVTLLVVSLEVPRDYEGLMDVVYSLPAFIICFTLLMTFWNAHYTYHRRYGIESVFSRVMTMALLVIVLFYVYPLKFLFTMLTVQIFGFELHDPPHLDGLHQVKVLYVIYGLGFAGVWGLFSALYGHALASREQLQLNAAETAQTRGDLYRNLIYVFVCCLSIALALLTNSDWLPGFIYFLLGPLQAANGWWSARQVQALASSR